MASSALPHIASASVWLALTGDQNGEYVTKGGGSVSASAAKKVLADAALCCAAVGM